MSNEYQIEEITGPSPGQILRKNILGHRGLMMGATGLLIIFIAALFAPLITPYDQFTQDLTKRLVQPVWHAEGSWPDPLE